VAPAACCFVFAGCARCENLNGQVHTLEDYFNKSCEERNGVGREEVR